jgi:phage terminase large subunit
LKPTKVFFETLRAVKDKKRNILHKGSARSGKTVGIAQAYDFIAQESGAHKRMSIVSQSFPHLKDGVIYEYEQYQKRERIHRDHNKGEHIFKINLSEINYFSLDVDGMKAIGPGRHYLWLNEPNKGITYQSYTDLDIRTQDHVIMDWNPSAEFWAHTEGEPCLIDDPRSVLIHSTWLDNIENLTPAQIQTFIDRKKLSKKFPYWAYWWKVYGEGEDGVLTDERIMPSIKWIKKVPDDAVEVPSGLDFGWFPAPTAYVKLWVRPKSKTGALMDDLYIQQVVYGTKLSINSKSDNVGNLVEVLEAKGVDKKHKIIAESADPRLIEEMRGAKFSIEHVHKTSVETSIALFHDYNIHILEGSNSVYKEFDNYRYKKNRQGKILGVPEDGQADHSIDATRYVLLSRNKRWSIK